MTDTVLLTGVSGFVGSHTAAELLRRGYTVRGTVRNLARADEVRTALRVAGVDTARLELRRLDLLSDEGWSDAAKGCRFVLHIASPIVAKMPRDPEQLVRPAVDGTKRAIEAALRAGAERIVLTSSLGAVQHAPAGKDHVFSASDWTDPRAHGVNAYAASKVRAERAAWDIVDKRGEHNRLAVINPGAVLGPLLSDDPGTSVTAIQQLMSGALPVIPDLWFPWVHVQDIADAHIEAMTSPVAGATRTIVTTDTSSLIEVAAVLRERLPNESRRMSRRSLPTWLTWIASVVEPQLRANRALIGTAQRFDRGPAEALLGRPLSSIPDAIEQAGRSLHDRGLLERTKR